METNTIEIYTDGSCHVSSKLGTWGAILLYDAQELVLSGIVEQTTHNRMELIAVLKAIEYLKAEKIEYQNLCVYSDSQYLVEIPRRKAKFLENDFCNKAGKPLNNDDLLRELVHIFEVENIQLIKVKAHQKKGEKINYNRKVDQLVRKLMRQHILENNLG